MSNNLLAVGNSPNYDKGAWVYEKLTNSSPLLVGQYEVFENITWVGAPLLAPGRTLLTSKATVKLRVTKPYKQYETVDSDKILNKNQALTVGNTYVVAYTNPSNTNPQASWGGQSVTHDGNTYDPGDEFIATNTSFSGGNKSRVIEHDALNSFNPVYSFNTDDIVATKGNTEVAKDAMELIRVVPNPYSVSYTHLTLPTNREV